MATPTPDAPRPLSPPPDGRTLEQPRPTAADRTLTQYQPGPPRPGPVASRLGPPGAPPCDENELCRVLRLRLAWIFTSALVPVVAFGLIGAAGWLPFFAPLTRGPGLAVQAAAAACFAAGVAAFLLARRPDATRLRWLEAAMYAAFAAYMAYVQFVSVRSCEPPGGFEGPGHAQGLILNAVLLSQLVWFVTVLQYGLLVPATWRRAGGMALALSAVNTASLLAAADSVEAARAHGPLLLTVVLALVFVSVGIALFGSYKIRTLQDEAAAARREARAMGQYRLKGLLGQGGMGKVYLAEHRLLKRPCAVKVIRPDRAADATALERFRREVEAMTSLTHPNVVDVYDYGRADDGSFYYAMEYLPGQNLDDLVRANGPLPPARAVYLMRQVCSALTEAHAKGLIHRDLKPSNILVCERGGRYDVVKLLDFGLVRHTGTAPGPGGDRVTHDGAVLGTPAYMAPEQAGDADAATAASDLYALGAITYYLLAGRPPFVRSGWVKTLAAHLDDPVPPLADAYPGVPADVEELVRRCLEKHPARRPESAAALEAAFAACGCGGEWTPDDAARWWRQCPGGVCPAGPQTAPTEAMTGG